MIIDGWDPWGEGTEGIQSTRGKNNFGQDWKSLNKYNRLRWIRTWISLCMLGAGGWSVFHKLVSSLW
jgi:hypothetical protein